MALPTRALHYLQELHRRRLIQRTIRSTWDDVRQFGVAGQLRYTLKVAGVENYMRIGYPGTEFRFRVGPTPFWKNWRMIETGTQDLEGIRFLSSFVKSGQTVLDVGAWEGPYALLFAKLVGAEGRVYAFEPDPRALAMLRDNVRANNLANVQVEDVCLSNTVGESLFYNSDGGTIGTLIRNETVAGFARIPVKTTTIDRYCRERGIVVSGMKVDVEGAEALVVEGAQDMIARHAPWLFLEFHGIFMPAAERRSTWARVTGTAREMTFVAGDSARYRPGDQLESYPDCDYFHVVIQF